MNNTQIHESSIDPRYGFPKRPKFNSNKDIPKKITELPPTKNILRNERKFFDSADWAITGEAHQIYPKLFTSINNSQRQRQCNLNNNNNDKEEKEKNKRISFIKNHNKENATKRQKRESKSVEAYNLERGRQYFDSADWMMKIDKQQKPPYPELLCRSRYITSDKERFSRHAARIHLNYNNTAKRTYFDSADWALDGRRVLLSQLRHHPKLGLNQ